MDIQKSPPYPVFILSEYFDHANWVQITSTGWDGMIDRFISIYEVLFDALLPPIRSKSRQMQQNIGTEGMANVGDQKNEVLRVDKGLFRAELKRLLSYYEEIDAFVFFKLVHMAFDRAINDFNSKGLIFYHIPIPIPMQLNFTRVNPSANWLVMVREPLQSCESWIRPKL